MRNTTMLKHILLKYDVLFTMNNDEYFNITLIDKISLNQQLIEGKSYSEILRKAYSFMMKELM